MHNFKISDKVLRTRGYLPNSIFNKKMGDEPYYTVTGVSPCGYWLQLDGYKHHGERWPWYAVNFELYQEPEDELPSAPDKVAYMNSKRGRGDDQRLVLEKDNGDGEGLMYIGVVPKKGSTRAKVEIGINIDPDSALQLAHDLRRMAMDIKRKEKAQ